MIEVEVHGKVQSLWGIVVSTGSASCFSAIPGVEKLSDVYSEKKANPRPEAEDHPSRMFNPFSV
jgi:hypothetical protein